MTVKKQSGSLSGRERLLRTLTGQPVDRMPIAPFLYYNAVYELFGYKPDMDNFFNPDDFDPIEKFVEYCDYFGFDILHVLGSVWDYYMAFQSSIDQSYVRAWDNWDVAIADERREDIKHRSVTISTPEGTLRHTEDYNRSSTYLIVSAYREYPIKTRRDFEILRRYAPPADNMDCSLIRRAREAVGDRGLVTSITHGAFNILTQFRYLTDVMMDPLVDEDLYREMMDYFVDRLINRVKKMIENGADVIEVAGNLAGSCVGPAYFERYVREYEQKLLEAIHENGALTIFHNCGDAAKVMHIYNSMDIDCWGYLTPRPFGDVDFDEALMTMKSDMALRGNIDQVEFMIQANPKEVEDRVRDVVLKAKERGNFILSTTDFFFDGTPYENIKAFAQAGLKYGQY